MSEPKPMSVDEAIDLVKQLRDKATIQGNCETFKAIDRAVDMVTTMAMAASKHKCKPGSCQCDTTPEDPELDGDVVTVEPVSVSASDPDPDPGEPAQPEDAPPVQSPA